MNVFALRNQIEFYLDQVKAPRFRDRQLAGGINAACRFILEKAFPSDATKKDTSEFERVLGSWSKYGVLVEHTVLTEEEEGTVLTVTNNLITRASMPADYMIYIGAEIYFNSDHYPAIPIPHSKALLVERDPYERASMAYPQRIYIKEISSGLEIITGDAAVATGAILEYLKIPTTVNFGSDTTANATIDPSTFVITGTHVDMTTLTGSNESIEGYCETACTFYDPGDAEANPVVAQSIKVLPAFSVQTILSRYTLVNGVLTSGHVNCSFPESLFDEVARVTAAILAGTINNLAVKGDLLNQPKM